MENDTQGLSATDYNNGDAKTEIRAILFYSIDDKTALQVYRLNIE